MPAPTTICSICNEEVLKSTTYHIGDGKRACKSHEGVVDTATSLKEKEQKRIEKEIKAKEEKSKRRFTPEGSREEKDVSKTPCLVCGKKGLDTSTHASLILQLMAAFEVVTGKSFPLFQFLEGKDREITMSLLNNDEDMLRKIFILPINNFQKEFLDKLLRLGRYKSIGMFLDITNVVAVCADCASGIPEVQEVIDKVHPTPTMKQISSMGIVSTVVHEDLKKSYKEVLDSLEGERNGISELSWNMGYGIVIPQYPNYYVRFILKYLKHFRMKTFQKD